MSLLTTWGYTMTEADTLEDLLTKEAFDVYTGGKYASQSDRILAEIKAASTAVRNYVGWHLYPSEPCRMETTMQDRRVTVVGRDLLIQLPARYVTAVSAVTVGSTSCQYSVDPNGILRVYDVDLGGVKRFTPVVVTYTAGLTEALLDPIQELVAHRVTHTLAVPSGITSEASGGVSVTYNANWINSARATALPGDNKEVLAPYRVQGVF